MLQAVSSAVRSLLRQKTPDIRPGFLGTWEVKGLVFVTADILMMSIIF
jgi:hypothetical protein